MKNKFIKWGLIILGIIALGFGIWKIISYKEKSFNQVELKSTNRILNATDMKYMDTIVSVGMDLLNIDSTILVIRNLESTYKPSAMEGYDLKAYIKSNGIQYVIWVSDLNRISAIETLSHELIHMRQYYEGKLIVNQDGVQWNGKMFDIINVKYEEYPWEIEAFNDQYNLSKKIKEILYN